MPDRDVRRAAVAGSWYPGEARALRAEIDGLLAAVGPSLSAGTLVGLVSPHAGLRYSGAVAAHAYAALRNASPRTVYLVGPAHRVWFEGASLYSRGAFETPLGRALVDEPAGARMRAASRVTGQDTAPHRDEHSLEMQLPFVQVVAPEAQIVPVLMGAQTRETIDDVGQALAVAAHGQQGAVLIASSDLSHYEPAPVAYALDEEVIAEVRRFSPDGLAELLAAAPNHACGGGPMVSVMAACRRLGATTSIVLRYADSGDAGERDKSRVVGYLAAAFTRDEA